jgi:trk system potassium uptake protein TrkA
MYIIVIGGGRVGYYLTRALLEEGHEVLIVEKNAVVCDTIIEELGSICFRGDGCEVATLEEVGTGRADMLVAVTGDDEDNLVACQVAKHRFNVPRTIARIRNPQNKALFGKLGIDVTVSSTDIILEQITEEVPTHPLTHLLEIRDSGLEIVEIRIPPESATIGKAIKELSVPQGSVLSLIIRKARKPIIPTPNTTIQAEDQVIAVTDPESEEALRTALRGE